MANKSSTLKETRWIYLETKKHQQKDGNFFSAKGERGRNWIATKDLLSIMLFSLSLYLRKLKKLRTLKDL